MNKTSRHLSTVFLIQHLNDGDPVLYRFPGDPCVDLRIDGVADEIRLRCPDGFASTPVANRYRNIEVSRHAEGGERFIDLVVRGRDLAVEGHAMFCAVADRIQLDNQDTRIAIAETLDRWKDVIAARTRLSRNEEVGLMGELLILEAMIRVRGRGSVEDWQGPHSGEHDFDFGIFDVEVKTTSTERRVHSISSLTQLRPNPSRPLFLASVQVTTGGQSARSLAETIQSIRKVASGSLLDDRLEALGWIDDASDLYVDKWRLRSAIHAIEIDEAFPAITPEALHGAVAASERVIAAEYQLDLESFPPTTEVPVGLSAVISAMEASS